MMDDDGGVVATGGMPGKYTREMSEAASELHAKLHAEETLLLLKILELSTQCPEERLQRIAVGNVGGLGNYEAAMVVAAKAHDYVTVIHILTLFAKAIDRHIDETKDEIPEDRARPILQFMRATWIVGKIHNYQAADGATVVHAIAPAVQTLKRCVGIVGIDRYESMTSVM